MKILCLIPFGLILYASTLSATHRNDLAYSPERYYDDSSYVKYRSQKDTNNLANYELPPVAQMQFSKDEGKCCPQQCCPNQQPYNPYENLYHQQQGYNQGYTQGFSQGFTQSQYRQAYQQGYTHGVNQSQEGNQKSIAYNSALGTEQNYSTQAAAPSQSDHEIANKITGIVKGNLFSRPYDTVNYQVHNGNVILNGSVDNSSDSKIIESKVRLINGVKNVENRLVVPR